MMVAASAARNLPPELRVHQEIHVSSWSELNDALYADSWQESISRFRSPHVFRGAADSSYDLRTSLQTGGFVPYEQYLLKHFRKYAPRTNVLRDTDWNWLAVGKHHGLPTRLLDWSYSPNVALHFATQDISRYDTDACIWCVNYVRVADDLPRRLKAVLRREGANIFTAEMLEAVAPTLPALDGLSTREFVLFFEPPSLDERIVNQFALFSVASPATVDLSKLLQDFRETTKRIIIPAALKWEIRDRLDQANVTERVLFPGLDGLSEWLKRYYTRR